jgi:hypothetical protein
MTDSWRKEAFELISAEVSKTFERLDVSTSLWYISLLFPCPPYSVTENDSSLFPISVVPLLRRYLSGIS